MASRERLTLPGASGSVFPRPVTAARAPRDGSEGARGLFARDERHRGAATGSARAPQETNRSRREHFRLARSHRLPLRAGAGCGRMRSPPGHGCPWCASLQWTCREVSGRGNIYCRQAGLPNGSRRRPVASAEDACGSGC